MDGRTASHRSARRTARARRRAVATVVCAYACEGLELPDDGLKDLSLHHRLDALVACLQEVLDMPTFSWRACCRLIVLRREQGREWSGSRGMGGREWEWTGRGTIESLKERATLRMLALRSNSNMIDCHSPRSIRPITHDTAACSVQYERERLTNAAFVRSPRYVASTSGTKAPWDPTADWDHSSVHCWFVWTSAAQLGRSSRAAPLIGWVRPLRCNMFH